MHAKHLAQYLANSKYSITYLSETLKYEHENGINYPTRGTDLTKKK